MPDFPESMRAQLPEAMRARLAELEATSPLETVREFLLGYVADEQDIAAIRARLTRIAAYSVFEHRRALSAFEAVLAAEWPPNTLAQLVGWDGNWVLDDPSDAGAAQFLRELAQMLREVTDDAE